MFFQPIYKPIPLIYNLVLAMLWRHPENVELEKVEVVHYCAAVSFLLPTYTLLCIKRPSILAYNPSTYIILYPIRDQSRGGTLAKKLTWTERTSRCLSRNGGMFTMTSPLISRLKILLQGKRPSQGHQS